MKNQVKFLSLNIENIIEKEIKSMKKIKIVRNNEYANVYVDDAFYKTFNTRRKYDDNVNEVISYFKKKGILRKKNYNTYELIEDMVEIYPEEMTVVYVALLNYKETLEKFLKRLLADEEAAFDPFGKNAYFIEKYTENIETVDSLINKLICSHIHCFNQNEV